MRVAGLVGRVGLRAGARRGRVLVRAAPVRTVSMPAVAALPAWTLRGGARGALGGGAWSQREGVEGMAFAEGVRWYTSYPDYLELKMPALSPTMEKGNLTEWRKKVGDRIEGGDIIAIIETDKSTMEWESIDEGFLAKILVEEGTEGVQVGDVLGVITEDEADIKAFADFSPSSSAPEPESEPKAAPAERSADTSTSSSSQDNSGAAQSVVPKRPSHQTGGAPRAPSGPRVAASPYARAIAADRGVNLGNVQGTGPHERIIAADVVSAPVGDAQAQAPAGAAAPEYTPRQLPTMGGEQYTDLPNSNIRKVIASRLSQSKQEIPHYYLTMEVRMDEILRVRQELNEQADGAYKLSVNDFVVKASALALRKVPECNSSWMDKHTRRHEVVDINVAVDTEAGLLTPLITSADLRGLSDINGMVKDLAHKGREGKLAPEQIAPGTFTISNLGMFGITQFCAVINPPQACILAVGTTQDKVVPKDDGEFGVVKTMTVTLSCDHRVVDGAVGAKWLNSFKTYMEDPLKMLL
mmetsp:Transcript_23706/g.66484  ORF Transcript_23706/g.66484 Transcript_23706/m.66484 type:complete len:525 (+) Transcript_23706:1-1575(+)